MGWEETPQRGAERPALLLAVARHILESRVCGGVLVERVFGMVREHLGADLMFSYQLAQSETMELVGAVGLSEEVRKASQRLQVGEVLCGAVAATREPMVVDVTYITEESIACFIKQMGARSYACHPLLGRDGQLLGTFAVISSTRDGFTQGEVDFLQTVSHFLALAWDRQRTEEALREANRRKDEFLATLAHELRNPLAPIRTGLQVLCLSPNTGPTESKVVEVMERQVAQMARLVDDLLDVSRITSGRVELKRERLTVRSVLESAVEVSRPLIDAGRHELHLQVPEEPLYLEVDPTRLAQVVGNLLNNAAKYTPDGGRIDLSAHAEGAEVVIRVADTGSGIAPEVLLKVFDLFTQAGRTLGQSQGGLGIGLALAKKLVEMHGGTIEVCSRGSGLGATFTVRLPLMEAAAVEGQASCEDRLHSEGAAQRLLVVDDNVDAAETLALMLEMLGHHAQPVHSGLEALDAARKLRPSVVFCDIGMPGMDGYEVARRFRQDATLAPTVLVALTGWGGESDKQQTKAAGFDFHLTKPVDGAAILGLLKQAGLAG